jgi:hypothetical protein
MLRVRRPGKAMGQVYQCWWRICREIICFSILEHHMFYILYPFVTYLLTLPRIMTNLNRQVFVMERRGVVFCEVGITF